MKTITKDILESDEWDVLLHCSNLYCTFGAGIAYHIKHKYPEMYRADCDTKSGDVSKLGYYTRAKLNDGRIGGNLYGMIPNDYHVLSDVTKSLSYDALDSALFNFLTDHEPSEGVVRVGVPYLIGCGLAGGNWTIVESILKANEDHFNGKFEIIVHKLPQ